MFVRKTNLPSQKKKFQKIRTNAHLRKLIKFSYKMFSDTLCLSGPNLYRRVIDVINSV